MKEYIIGKVYEYERERVKNGKRYKWKERYIRAYVPRDVFNDVKEVIIIPKKG